MNILLASTWSPVKKTAINSTTNGSKKNDRLLTKSSAYGRRDLSRWPRGTLYPHKLAIASPTSGGRSVGIVRSRTQTMEFSFSLE
jgi:hypothetical protein